MDTNIKNNWKFGLEEQGELALYKVSGIQYNVGQISNDVTKAQLLMNKLDRARDILRISPYGSLFNGKEQYTGLVKDSDNVISMSYGIENGMYKEAEEAAPSEENIKKFLSDYCKVGRMRQELTIDYAKKLTDLSGIQELLNSKVKAMGLLPHNISFSIKDSVKIKYPTYQELMSEEMRKLEISPEANPKIILEDDLHLMQVDTIKYTQRVVEDAGGLLEYIHLQEPVYEMEEALATEGERSEKSIFLHMKNMYKDIVAILMKKMNAEEQATPVAYAYDCDSNTSEESDIEFNEAIKRIENMLRMATKNMTPEERAAKIKLCARRGGDNTDENKFYLHICKEEYLLWLISMGLNTCEYIGEKLYDESSKESKVEEGDILDFVDGECNDGIHQAFIEVPYTGKLTVFKKDNRLYAGKSMKEAIKVPEPNNKIMIKVSGTFGIENGSTINAYRVLNSRIHNRTKIIASCNEEGKISYNMIIRNAENKIQKVPVFIPSGLETSIINKLGTITGTYIGTITSSKGVAMKVIYANIDLD